MRALGFAVAFAAAAAAQDKPPRVDQAKIDNAIERAGMIFGTERFGSHEWYPEGVDFLLPAQKEDGRWQADGSHAIGDTCFAILFLRRATKGLPKVATGR